MKSREELLEWARANNIKNRREKHQIGLMAYMMGISRDWWPEGTEKQSTDNAEYSPKNLRVIRKIIGEI